MNFREKVYNITKQIPKGKVATYGQIARFSGSSKASRVVGYLMKTNPYAPDVPCHRVVGWNGKLTGYNSKDGIKEKKKMLVEEGVVFKGDTVDLEKCQFEFPFIPNTRFLLSQE